MNKQELLIYLVKNKFIELPDKFTGQVTLICNINQGGITDIEKSIKERLR